MTKRLSRYYECPTEFALDVLGGKWKTVLLCYLKQRPLRYSELRRQIPSLSDKMLTQRLADLVEIGFVTLESSPDGKDRYAVTERGRDLAAALQALYDWGSVHGRAEGVRFRTDAEAAA